MLEPRLRHVVAVARAGSFTAAAAQVGVSQSAVTRGVADLERQIGFAIFHRTARGALLTERGRDFVERAARLLDDAHELISSPGGADDPYADTLRVGVCPASIEWRVADPLEQLITRHPSVRVDLSASSFERMVPLLRGGAVDVAVGPDAGFAVWTDLRRVTLAGSETALFVRKGHPLLGKTSLDAADLAAFDFVSPSDSRPYGEVIRNIYTSQGVDWRRRIHVIDYFPIVRRFVAATDAIGVVDVDHSDMPQFRDHFATLDAARLFEPAPLCCAVRGGWELKPAAKAFISMCAAHMR
jgi:DNA-binding transcriptional LysR family regulator